jgi:hypothetical protein
LPIFGRISERETTTELSLTADLLNRKKPGNGAGSFLDPKDALLCYFVHSSFIAFPADAGDRVAVLAGER